MAKDLIGASEIMLMMQITSRGGGVLCCVAVQAN